MRRIIIIGNSGSGKTTLAKKLGGILSIQVSHLDNLFWEPGSFSQKRSKEIVFQDISLLKDEESWIVEGVFGDLAQEFLERADCLIWLDMTWEVCHANLLQRGSESSRQLDPVQAEINFAKLLVWASHYYDRDNLRSHQGHKLLYTNFSKSKYYLKSKVEVEQFLSTVS